MPLRDRLPQETLAGLELARKERFNDGYHLAVDERRMGAIYLLGYAVEMTLKSAYFRWIEPTEPGLPLGPERLQTARAHARDILGIIVPDESYHSPLFWAHLIVARRENDSSPLDVTLASALIASAQCVWSNWKVSMRYHGDISTEGELYSVFREAEWMHTHYEDFWS